MIRVVDKKNNRARTHSRNIKAKRAALLQHRNHLFVFRVCSLTEISMINDKIYAAESTMENVGIIGAKLNPVVLCPLQFNSGGCSLGKLCSRGHVCENIRNLVLHCTEITGSLCKNYVMYGECNVVGICSKYHPTNDILAELNCRNKKTWV